MIRPIEYDDAESCGKVGYKAHENISSIHDYPSEQPSEDYAIGLIKSLLDNQSSWGVLAEQDGKVLGSIFIHEFPPSPVAVIGPVTVHPAVEGSGIGRTLMEAALIQASKQKHDQIRLVQSPSHIRSFVLYTKCGFVLREPLFLMQGKPLTKLNDKTSNSANIRLVRTEKEISTCNELCRSVHGFSREAELRQAKDQGVAAMIERDGVIAGYAAGIGILNHAVAKSNEELKALIANASTILGPGFFVPAKNHEVINWLLQNSFQIGWPANLMTIGPYEDPLSPFLPSLAY